MLIDKLESIYQTTPTHLKAHYPSKHAQVHTTPDSSPLSISPPKALRPPMSNVRIAKRPDAPPLARLPPPLSLPKEESDTVAARALPSTGPTAFSVVPMASLAISTNPKEPTESTDLLPLPPVTDIGSWCSDEPDTLPEKEVAPLPPRAPPSPVRVLTKNIYNEEFALLSLILRKPASNKQQQ